MSLFDKVQSVGNFLKDRFSNKNVFEKEEEEKGKNPVLENFATKKPNPFLESNKPKSIPQTKVRVSDVVKEIPGQFSKQIGQPTLRGYVSVGNFIANKLGTAEGPFKPQGQFQKDLLGTDKPISLTSEGKPLLEVFGKGKEGTFSGKYVAPIIGFTLPILDAIPGGSALKAELKGVPKILSTIDNADDVTKELSKFKLNLPKLAIEEIAKTKNTAKIEKILVSELETQAAVARQAIKSRQALTEQAKTFNTADEFVEQTLRTSTTLGKQSDNVDEIIFKNPEQGQTTRVFGEVVDNTPTELKVKYLDDTNKSVIQTINKADVLPSKKEELELIWDTARGGNDLIVKNNVSGEEFKILTADTDGAKIQSSQTGEVLSVKADDMNAKFTPVEKAPMPPTSNIPPTPPAPPQVPGVQKSLEDPNLFRERSLPRGAAEAGTLNPEVQKRMSDFNYNVLTNDALLKKAGEDIQTAGIDVMRERFLLSDSIANAAYDNAVGIRLVEEYDNLALATTDPALREELYQKSADIFDKLAQKATSGGQSVQILSLVSKQNPTVRRHFINKTLNNLNDILPPGTEKVKLNEDDWKKISNFFAEADASNTDWMKAVKTQQATSYILDKFGDKIPWIVRTSIKAKKYRYISMLLNPKTYIRNIIGNKAFARLEQANNFFATPMDKILSKKSNARTVSTLDWAVWKKAAKEGAERAKTEIDLGVDTRMDKLKRDYPTTKFNSKTMQALDRWTQTAMRVPDRAAFEGTFESELASIMKSNNMTEPTDWMIDMATEAAEYRTFQDDTLVANIFENSRKWINKLGNQKLLKDLGFDERGQKYFGDQMLGLGDLIMPFVRTPFNLLSRGLAYTPLGLAKGLYTTKRFYSLAEKLETIKKTQPNNSKAIKAIEKELFRAQREATTSFSRGALGTGALVLPGYMLAKMGVISSKYNAEEAAAEGAKRKLGMGPNRINMTALTRLLTGGDPAYQPGDVTVSYDWLMPASIPISVGVAMAKLEEGGLLNKVLQLPIASFEIIENQPMLTTLKKLAGEGYNEGFAQGIADVVGEIPQSFVPTFFNQLRQLTDPKKRQVKDDSLVKEMFINRIANRLPLLSKTLQPKVDAFGNIEESIYNQEKNNFAINAFNAFANPAFISKVTDDPKEVDFMLDLFNATGKQEQFPEYVMNRKKVTINVDGEKVERKVSPQERAQMQTYIGMTTRALVYEKMRDKNFMKLDDVDKVEELGDIANDAKNAAESIFLDKDVSKRSSKRVRSLVAEYESIKKKNQSYIKNLSDKYDFRP